MQHSFEQPLRVGLSKTSANRNTTKNDKYRIKQITTHVVGARVAASLLNPATEKDQPLMGLHAPGINSSGVKPLRALTPACQKTNPDGVVGAT